VHIHLLIDLLTSLFLHTLSDALGLSRQIFSLLIELLGGKLGMSSVLLAILLERLGLSLAVDLEVHLLVAFVELGTSVEAELPLVVVLGGSWRKDMGTWVVGCGFWRRRLGGPRSRRCL